MYGKAVQDALRGPMRALRKAIPGVFASFSKLHDAAREPGALDAKTKELIALAIAVCDECDGCIGAHARGAAHRSATEVEVAEAIGVAILMKGGSATVYGPRAYAAFLEFAAGEPITATAPASAGQHSHQV